MTEYKIQLFLC